MKRPVLVLAVFILATSVISTLLLRENQKLERSGGSRFASSAPQQTLEVTDNEIKYLGTTLEIAQTLPYLFPNGLVLNDNVYYTASLINATNSEESILRLNKMALGTNGFFNKATVFYLFNRRYGKYERVLQSSKEQNEARFPSTDVFFYKSILAVKFDYDVARPLECFGDGCRVHWLDYYLWNERDKKFDLATTGPEFKSYYEDLLSQYEDINRKGCSIRGGTVEMPTLEAVYNYSADAFCEMRNGPTSSREELVKYFEYWEKLKKLLGV